jgi:hypothetical protein
MQRVIKIERPDMAHAELRIQFVGLEKLPAEKLKILENRLNADKSHAKITTSAKVRYLMTGSSVVVDAGVSRDLELSTATGAMLPDIPRLASCMLFKWQDTTLPELLLYIGAADGGKIGVFGTIDSIERASDGTPAGLFFHFGESDFPQFMADDITAEPEIAVKDLVSLSKEEDQAVRYVMRLALKTLAYAAIPQHKPTLLASRAEIKAAGIHPKHVLRPAYRVKYLPRIIRPREDSENAQGSPTAFLGRSGHLRLYKDDRYTNMRGKWQWIPPIEPPDGVKVVFKIRKV